MSNGNINDITSILYKCDESMMFLGKQYTSLLTQKQYISETIEIKCVGKELFIYIHNWSPGSGTAIYLNNVGLSGEFVDVSTPLNKINDIIYMNLFPNIEGHCFKPECYQLNNIVNTFYDAANVAEYSSIEIGFDIMYQGQLNVYIQCSEYNDIIYNATNNGVDIVRGIIVHRCTGANMVISFVSDLTTYIGGIYVTPSSDTQNPTKLPTKSPTYSFTLEPTLSPTFIPTNIPTNNPTELPSHSPTFEPTFEPTIEPTKLTYIKTNITRQKNITNITENISILTETVTISPTISPTTEPIISPTIISGIIPPQQLKPSNTIPILSISLPLFITVMSIPCVLVFCNIIITILYCKKVYHLKMNKSDFELKMYSAEAEMAIHQAEMVKNIPNEYKADYTAELSESIVIKYKDDDIFEVNGSNNNIDINDDDNNPDILQRQSTLKRKRGEQSHDDIKLLHNITDEFGIDQGSPDGIDGTGLQAKYQVNAVEQISYYIDQSKSI